MSVTGNFASITRSGKGLLVTGNSASSAPAGAKDGGVQAEQGELMSRHIALSQGARVTKEKDPDPVVGGWKIEVPDGGMFSDRDPILAVGVETYFMAADNAETHEKLPSFATLTWSQTLKIT